MLESLAFVLFTTFVAYLVEKIRVAVIEKYQQEAFSELQTERPVEGKEEQDLELEPSQYLKGSQSALSPPQDAFRELEQDTATH
jgi:hypothetical protein